MACINIGTSIYYNIVYYISKIAGIFGEGSLDITGKSTVVIPRIVFHYFIGVSKGF